MERAQSYIKEIKENIRRVLDLPPCTSEDFLPPGPRRDPRSIIASLQNHLEAVLAGTSNGPMDVASIVGDETTVPSSSEQDLAARRRGNAAACDSVVRSEHDALTSIVGTKPLKPLFPRLRSRTRPPEGEETLPLLVILLSVRSRSQPPKPAQSRKQQTTTKQM